MGPSTETSGLQANAASDAARSHVVRRPPVVSIYSAWRDRFVRVDEDGTLHADVEYPWSERSWFSILRLSSNMSIASPHDDWPRHSKTYIGYVFCDTLHLISIEIFAA